MLPRLRIILSCLLMLAIPVQGLAAAGMWFCGSAQHHQALGSQAHVDASHAQHGMAMHSQSADFEALQAQPLDSAASKFMSSEETACTVCAVCCQAAVLRVSFLATPFVVIAPEPLLAESVGEFITDNPERPPRNFFA